MKPIYEPRGRAREYSYLALNVMRGCSSQCSYCYVPGASRMSREQWAKIKPAPRKRIIEALRKQAPEFAGTDRRCLLCFMCDPYQPAAVESGVTRQALEILREHDIPWQVLTKHGMRAVGDFDLYGPNDAFATTLTTAGSEAWTWEPGAAEPSDRIEAIQRAKKAGIETWVSLEPVMDPDWSLRIIQMTYHVVDLFKIGKLNHDKVREAEIDWGRFGWEAVALCDKYGVDYYVKEDLRKHMMDVGQAALRNKDTRRVSR